MKKLINIYVIEGDLGAVAMTLKGGEIEDSAENSDDYKSQH